MSEENRRAPRDIEERTFKFACRVVQLCQYLDEQRGAARQVGWQLMRSGTSIGANCEEARAAQTKPDFIAKLSISLKESRETSYWLRLLSATKLVAEKRLAGLINESNQSMRILGAILTSARRKKPPDQ
jgi:four helix bundle protein